MKSRTAAFAFLVLMGACAASGKQAEPTYKVYQYFDLEVEYTATVNTLASMREAGKFTKSTAAAIDIVIKEGQALLNQIHASIDEQLKTLEPGEKVEVDVDLKGSFLNVLEKLLYYKARYK